VPPGTIPDESEIKLNGAVLAFTLVVSALTSVVCGLLPALHTSRQDFAGALRETNLTLAGLSRQALMRKNAVVAEVALSLMLLVGSTTLLRVFVDMQRVALAVDPARILTMRVPLPQARLPRCATPCGLLQGVAAACQCRARGGCGGVELRACIPGEHVDAFDVTGEPPTTDLVSSPPCERQLFERGRDGSGDRRLFTDSDIARALPVALVNERFVRSRIGRREPLGQVVHLPRLKEPPFLLPRTTGLRSLAWSTTRSTRASPSRSCRNSTFRSVSPGAANLVVVRAVGNPADITRAVVGQVYAIDRGQPVTAVTTLDQLLKENQYATPRFNLVLLSVFSIVGLALACGRRLRCDVGGRGAGAQRDRRAAGTRR
jgi:hypothetical protein